MPIRPHLPPAVNVVRAVLDYQIPGAIAQNVYHFQRDRAWSQDSLAECASAIINWEIGFGTDLRSNQVGLLIVRLVDLTSSSSMIYSQSPDTFTVGKQESDILPQNCTMALHATTGFRGSGRQGRIFWIGLTEDQTDGSTIHVDTLDAILVFQTRLITEVAAGHGNVLSVLHRTRDGVVLNPAVTSPILNWNATHLTTDSQVNRLPGRSRPSHRR